MIPFLHFQLSAVVLGRGPPVTVSRVGEFNRICCGSAFICYGFRSRTVLFGKFSLRLSVTSSAMEELLGELAREDSGSMIIDDL